LDNLFAPLPKDIWAKGENRGTSFEVKQALLVLVQFGAGVAIARNALDLLLPSVPTYQSPIGDGLFVFFYYYNQPRMRARIDYLAQLVISRAVRAEKDIAEDLGLENNKPGPHPTPDVGRQKP
jgi:hypothetical protein